MWQFRYKKYFNLIHESKYVVTVLILTGWVNLEHAQKILINASYTWLQGKDKFPPSIKWNTGVRQGLGNKRSGSHPFGWLYVVISVHRYFFSHYLELHSLWRKDSIPERVIS